MSWNHVDVAAVAPMPWKNGGGVTRELLAWPDAAAWRVRVSIAQIDRAGPFSAYPGVHRCFAVLSGAGVRLRIDGVAHALTTASGPVAFAGESAVDCELLAGPTTDLNVMVRGGKGILRRLQGVPRLAVRAGQLVAACDGRRLAWQILANDATLEAPMRDAWWMEVTA